MPAWLRSARTIGSLLAVGMLLLASGGINPAGAQQQSDEAMSCAQLRSAMWRESKGLKQAALLAEKPARKTVNQVMATGGPSREVQDKAEVALSSILAGGFKSKESKAALKDLARQAGDDLEYRHHIPKSQLLQDFAPAAVAGAPSYQRLSHLRALTKAKGCSGK